MFAGFSLQFRYLTDSIMLVNLTNVDQVILILMTSLEIHLIYGYELLD